YMPANIEIIKPDEINLRNSDITGMTNKIVQRIHYYDAVARRLMVDNQNMRKQLGLPDPSAQPSQPSQQVPQQSKDKDQSKKQKKATKPKKSKKK
ncbi:MAG TPA: hypothetical protein VHA12_02170, partial [Candidatus Nanoarchaeia archaeon]|nr:hypothetical protein [Candidatus Nanoarchaeia archaeon]